MGLFLQKTNITRDYLEDISAVNPRIWWPKTIWFPYFNKLDVNLIIGPSMWAIFMISWTLNIDLKLWVCSHNFFELSYRAACLNHMVTNAMEHVFDCLDYLDKLTDPTVFQFCAIPQVCRSYWTPDA